MKKKLPFLFSILLITALFLAACSGGENTNVEGTPGLGETSGTEMVPETGDNLDSTMESTDAGAMDTTATEPATTTEATATIEAPATDDASGTVATATLAADGEATPADGASSECRPYRLTSFLDYEVRGSDGTTVGEVNGLVVARDAALTANGAAPDFTSYTAGQYANPVVTYFVVDFDDAAGYSAAETLIPFTAFSPLGADTMLEDCQLVFAGTYDLSASPEFSSDAMPDFSDQTWDGEFSTFWSGLGVNVMTTASGGQQLGNPVVFRDTFDDIDVLNPNGEDLGEIEDFIIDPATGEINYAVLAAGGFLGLGEKLIPVPMEQILWGSYDDDNNDLGEIYINHPDDGWDQAPVIDNLDDMDFSTDAWSADYDTYWEGLGGGTGTDTGTDLTPEPTMPDSTTPEATVAP